MKIKEPTPENLAKARCSKCNRIGGLYLESPPVMKCKYCGEKFYKRGTVIDL